jgi:phosphatidylinositol alpha-1,6-mannosyltransferase
VKSRRKRILLVLPEVFGATGGIQMYCRSLCLAAGGWAEQNDVSLDALVLNDHAAPDSRYVNGGFGHFVTAGKSKSRLVASYLKHVLPNPPDLVVFGHISLSKLAVLPGVRLRRTCIIAYGIEVWRTLELMEKRALLKADAVLAISEYTMRELIKRNSLAPERIKLIRPSLDPHSVPDGSPQEAVNPPVILTVTRMARDENYKGVDSVIRSLPAVVDQLGPVDYRIVGRGDDIPRLQALAREVGVSQYVTFTGELSAAALSNEYRYCSLFVMPSEMEGFGIVFLEAMAYSKAVIGGAHAGTSSVVRDGETGILVGRSDIEGITSAIVKILKDDELRSRLGRSGYQRLLDVFTFQRFDADIRELLESQL